MNWRDTPTGHHCDKHDLPFLRGEVCTRCTTSDAVLADSPASELDADIIADAARYGANAKRLWREAEDLLDNGTALDKNTACKLSSEAIRWERLKLEAKDKVAARAHLREAMAHEREMTTARTRAD